MNKINTVPKSSVLDSIVNPTPGDVILVEDTGTYWMYSDEWSEVQGEVNEEGLAMSLYELNRSIIEGLPVMNADQLAVARDLIKEYQAKASAKYYALVGREYNYYTMFQVHSDPEVENLAEGVMECLSHVGEIVAINTTEDENAIESWIRVGEDIHYLLLFPYDGGVVTIG